MGEQFYRNEIKRLTNIIKNSNEVHNQIIKSYEEENQQLKDKISKAIEYIEEEIFGIKYGKFVKPCGYENTYCDDECEELVQILKGVVK